VKTGDAGTDLARTDVKPEGMAALPLCESAIWCKRSMSHGLSRYGVDDPPASLTTKQVTMVNAPAVNIGLIEAFKLPGVPTFAVTFSDIMTMRCGLSGVVKRHLNHSLGSETYKGPLEFLP